MQNASEGMVGAILGLSVWHVTALSGVGRQDCPCKRRPVRIRQSKVNRPNVAPMGVTSLPIHWRVVDRYLYQLDGLNGFRSVVRFIYDNIPSI